MQIALGTEVEMKMPLSMTTIVVKGRLGGQKGGLHSSFEYSLAPSQHAHSILITCAAHCSELLIRAMVELFWFLEL